MNVNPYESSRTVDPAVSRGFVVRSLTSLLLVATIFAFWWGTPIVLRTIQVFHKSDLKLNIVRVTTAAMLVLSTLQFGFASYFCWHSRWRRSAATLAVGMILFVAGTLVIRAYRV